MPSNFEIAILALLIVNLLATVYYNYQSEEDYAQARATTKPTAKTTKKTPAMPPGQMTR